jgi:hypothetical protein
LSISAEETLLNDLNSTEPPARKLSEPKPKFNETLPFRMITRSMISSLIPVKIAFKLSTDYPQISARVAILSGWSFSSSNVWGISATLSSFSTNWRMALGPGQYT